MSSEAQLTEQPSPVDDFFDNDLGTFTAISWEPNDDLPFERWDEVILSFYRAKQSLPFYIGDGLNWGEAKYGEMYSQAKAATGKAYSTLANYKWIAGEFTPEERHPDLDWDHHRHVATLPKEAQQIWLDRAEEAAWSTRELKRAILGHDILLLDNIESISRPKRRLMTEFMGLGLASDGSVEDWLDRLGREEINRLLDGEMDSILVRLTSLMDVLRLY